MPKSETLNENLTENEQLFVEYYFIQSSDTFGNGTQSIIRAFGEKEFLNKEGNINYNLAGVKAHELLRTPKIYKKGSEYLNNQGFNDSSVDSQHSFLINQSADLPVKQRSIDMYNKLMGRYEKNNTQVGDAIGKLLADTQDLIGTSEAT